MCVSAVTDPAGPANEEARVREGIKYRNVKTPAWMAGIGSTPVCVSRGAGVPVMIPARRRHDRLASQSGAMRRFAARFLDVVIEELPPLCS